jgi:hypothetical protein
MKIKDIVQESVYDFFTKGQAAINRAGAMEKERQDIYRKGIVPSTEPPKPPPAPPPEPEYDFTKELKFDKNLGIIKYGKEAFKRDASGQWISMTSGKPVADRYISVLDKISPPKVSPAPSTARGPVGGRKAATITDKAGVVWTYDEDNGVWLTDDGKEATPQGAVELTKRAKYLGLFTQLR